ncbi:MAG: LytTR family DNA-binding domain-containing protein [Bacteroidota bacterium]
MKSAITIAIVDDEADARFLLRQELEKQFSHQIALIAEAESVQSAKRLLKTQSIDLLFLDIQLADGTGFNLLESLPEVGFSVVFVTAYSDFALRAFDFFAFAYLVKPFKQKDLIRVVNQFLDKRQPSHSSSIKLLSESIANCQITQVVVADLEGFRIVPVADIIYLKSDGNYTLFQLQDEQKIICSKTLKEYDLGLETAGFFRTHRSYLVNLTHVRSFTRQDGGTVEMSNGHTVPIGRRRLGAFREKFLG